MARVDVDRNLLFGLLALQNNFIDRADLLDAFGRWVHDRAIPLGQILRDRGALKPDEHDLLQAVVVKHLERFGSDPEKSLRHLSSIGSVREDLDRIADTDLQASLANVSTARPDDEPDRTVMPASLGESTSVGGRFRILRPHAKGGLGQVSVALDQELDRPVALKEIRYCYADDPHSRARFVEEAEITGKLEHPGIIPVYGLGYDAMGRPFYAMRFIQGGSLEEAIATFHGAEGLKQDTVARMSRLRELLRRFTDVCNAIAYAHSRGVLHRDLKPGNIMLGPYGETLVVDWGLAKPSGDMVSGEAAPRDGSLLTAGPIRLSGQYGSRAETVAGSPIGTPAYASPEQLTGNQARSGPATDIYGLGATLYALLTGQPPIESNDLGEIIHRVERGEIPPPRSIDPTIAKPLEAICQKAMATDPDDRYDSARALANDVTKWLDDEPVTAYREPASVRAGRWMRQHRTAMIGVAVAGLVGLIGLGAVVAVQTHANRDLKVAEENTSRALIAEKKARNDETEARTRAETVLTFLEEDLLAAARPKDQERGLGKDVTIRQAVDAVRPRIAVAFKNQPIVEASIRNTLGQTYYYLGESELAITELGRSRQLRRDILGVSNAETLKTMNHLAMAYHDADRLKDALALYQETLNRRKAALGPYHNDTLASMNNLALVYQKAERWNESRLMLEETVALQKARIGVDDPETLLSMNNLASAYQHTGQLSKAISLFEETLVLQKVKLPPDHPDTLRTMSNLAGAFLDDRRTTEAIPLFKEVLERFRAKIGAAHADTLLIMNNLAAAYLVANRPSEAIPLFEETLALQKVNLPPGHLDTLKSMNNLAKAYVTAHRPIEAIPLLEQTLKVLRDKVGPETENALTTMNNLADAYLASKKWTDAERTARD